MDEELPRTNSSINNRSELCRVLHLENLYKKNKVKSNTQTHTERRKALGLITHTPTRSGVKRSV